MVFNTSNRLIKNLNFKINNQEIIIVREFCYLGTIFTPNGKFKMNHSMLKNKAMKSLFSLRYSTLSQKMISPSLCLKLFDQLISPILLYGAENWANELSREKSSLEQISHQFYCFILGVGKMTPKIGVRGELGRLPIQVKAVIAQLKYWYRLNMLPENHILHCALKESNINKSNWIKNIEKVIGHTDFKKMNADYKITNSNQFTNILKSKLKKEYIQSWKVEINGCRENEVEGNKLRTYKLFKDNFEMEKYLTNVKDYSQRKMLARFRLSDHNLEIELGRRRRPKIPKDKRLCQKCKTNSVEDEVHFIMNCPEFNKEREILFDDCGIERSNKTNTLSNFKNIMSSNIALAKYLKCTIFKPLNSTIILLLTSCCYCF